MIERIYIRGSKEHWKEVYEWVYGKKPKEDYDVEGSCFASDTCIILRQRDNVPFILDKEVGYGNGIYKMLYDVITTNPHWHEVKPWEDKPYEPKPFDKVLGWKDDDPSDICPDIFLRKSKHYETRKTVYICSLGCWEHIKPYNEKEYLERVEEL